MSTGLHIQSVRDQEARKYQAVWSSVPGYGDVSPGLDLVGPFLSMSGVQPGETIIDVGCGTGKASVKFAELLMAPLLIDDTDARDGPARDLLFLRACLWSAWPNAVPTPQGNRRGTYRDWVFCADVLEHLPTEFTMLTVDRCLDAAPRAFFSIAFEPDSFGAFIGEPLHLTVQPFTWWRDRLAELGTLTEARDLLGRGLFILERS